MTHWYRRLRLRRLSLVVMTVFVLVSAGLYLGANHVVNDQEKRLLNERTAEVGVLLSSSLSGSLQTGLTALALAAQQPSSDAFDQAAKAGIKSTVTTIALLARDGDRWFVESSAGAALISPDLTGARLALLQSADGTIRSDLFNVAPGQYRLAVVLGAPVAPAGTVVYEEFVVDPSRPAKVTQTAPFHELNVALYVGSTVNPEKLLLATTSKVPLSGQVVTSEVPIGSSTWVVAATARQPLAGSLASDVPRILSLAALLIGLAMMVVVESIGRRRDYALTLVAERTNDLKESLGEVERAQEKLVAHERLAALGQMAATVGHELRNPLGVLTNSLYLIRNSVSATSDDRLRRQLDTADREISAATLIVSDLLEFSKPRAANPIAVDVTELLAETVSVAPPPKGIQIEFDETDVPSVTADRDQLRQVVLNLLTNAYEAMPDGGTVRFGARTVDDSVEIMVTDSGVGMDDATLAQVFEPFFSSKIKGTGLGLAVSKRIIEKHEGTLTMQSREGLGCTAIVRLPLVLTAVGATR